MEFIKKLGSIDIYKYFTFAEENEKTIQEIRILRENNQKLQQVINNFKENNWYNHYHQMKQAYEMKSQDYTKLHTSYEDLRKTYMQIRTAYDQLVKESKEHKINAEKYSVELQNQKESWEQDEKKYLSSINILNDEIESLKLETIHYQSALGNAINVRWDDEDSNNSVNLTKDIRNLQEVLREFTFLKGKAYLVNKPKIQQILNIMNSKADIDHKPSISAVLQHLTIKKILKFYDDYIQERNRSVYNHNDNSILESRLVICAENLINLVKDFTNTREGDDNITGITEIKIRQEIYAMLGNRGFGQKGNQIMKELKRQLLKLLEHYRSITEHTVKKEQENRAEEIVLGFTRILNFRLLTQEPVATIRWFEHGEPLNEILMEWVSTDEDETNMVVDICAFPAIGVYLNDPTKWQIYIKAKVQICSESNNPQKKPETLVDRAIKTYTNLMR
ncbi:2313_t:CDS:1 [Ambispora leptoticha]|uniref:2313_t:CDS:1 n=1 Tax=Ambispora leptoticha TaxID=144679 RepID=A0A9N9EP65_9GLOM|nr:2313_t:CDS:1 [Ambispora leptoticha]